MSEIYEVGYKLAVMNPCPICGNRSYYEQKTVAKSSSDRYLNGKLLICKVCGNSRSFYSKEALGIISLSATTVGEAHVDSHLIKLDSDSNDSDFDI